MIITGVDKIKDIFDKSLKGKRVALISGSSNIDSFGKSVFLTLKSLAGKNFKEIWSLQHGFFIDKQDNMVFSKPFYWKDMDIEVRSLYGESLLPEKDWIKDIDIILVDIFDIGTRVYTFINHIVKIMKTLSGKEVKFIILDRPNPLCGKTIEGNIAEEDYFSIVGNLPVPMRHSLTVGEYIRFAVDFYGMDINYQIVKLENWQRGIYKPLWTYPSPNMPTHDTAIVYPGAVMLEGTNISEGRGTTRPFEFIGAPFIDNYKLTDYLNRGEFKAVSFIPIFFKPEFSKFKDEICKGVFVSVKDIANFRSFKVYYEIIRYIYSEYPDSFEWKKPPYEYEYERLPIDMISSSDFIRKSIEKALLFKDIEEKIENDNKIFKERIKSYLLY